MYPIKPQIKPEATYPLDSPARPVLFQPCRWYIVVSATDAVTGHSFPVARHDCSSLLHARTLLTELRELAADLAESLPGLTAQGYELAECSAI